MFEWRKLGKVFDPRGIPDRPWLKEFAQAPATLLFDDVVRVYFSCRPPADGNGQYVSYSAWVDLDRADHARQSANLWRGGVASIAISADWKRAWTLDARLPRNFKHVRSGDVCHRIRDGEP